MDERSDAADWPFRVIDRETGAAIVRAIKGVGVDGKPSLFWRPHDGVPWVEFRVHRVPAVHLSPEFQTVATDPLGPHGAGEYNLPLPFALSFEVVVSADVWGPSCTDSAVEWRVGSDVDGWVTCDGLLTSLYFESRYGTLELGITATGPVAYEKPAAAVVA